MEHGDADPLRAGHRRRVLISGAAGQLGRALASAFADEDIIALRRAEWDVRFPAPAGLERPDLVLHTAAWTNVDGAEDDPQSAAEVNVGGTAHAAEIGAPLVAYSTRPASCGAITLFSCASQFVLPLPRSWSEIFSHISGATIARVRPVSAMTRP